eukprot:s33_g10.t1
MSSAGIAASSCIANQQEQSKGSLSSAWLCAANVKRAELAHAARHEPEAFCGFPLPWLFPTCRDLSPPDKWVQYPASPIKDESEEEVIFLSSSGPESQDPPFPGFYDQAHKAPGKRKSHPTGTTSSSKDDSSDPEIIEFVSQARN